MYWDHFTAAWVIISVVISVSALYLALHQRIETSRPGKAGQK